MQDYVRTVAETFVKARKAGQSVPSYPVKLPQDLETAYRIQDEAIALDGRDIFGWKVGRINPPDDSRFACNRLSGPIFADTVTRPLAGEVPSMKVYAGGFGAAEAELLLHVAAGYAGPIPHNDASTAAIVDEVRLGVEIASSPYAGINDDGAAVTVSDFGNNAGLVMGAALPGWRDLDLCAIPVITRIDGKQVGEGSAATMLDGPFGAARFLLENLALRGIDCSHGLWISTGAITGVHRVMPGQRVSASFGSLGNVDCTIAAAAVT